MGAPKTLPANFDGFDDRRAPAGNAPATLPANFEAFDDVSDQALARPRASHTPTNFAPARTIPTQLPTADPLAMAPPELSTEPTVQPPTAAPTRPPQTLPPGVGEARAWEPSFLENLYDTVRNSAIGHSIESTLPGLADTIGMHPNETVYNPDRAAHEQQLLAPEMIIPASSHGPIASTARGALKGAGGMTSGSSMATMAAAAATGGLLSPAVPAIGKLISLGFGVQTASDLVHESPELLNNVGSAEWFEHLGRMGFDAVMLKQMIEHASGREVKPSDITNERSRQAYNAQETERMGGTEAVHAYGAGSPDLLIPPELASAIPSGTVANRDMADRLYRRAVNPRSTGAVVPRGTPIEGGPAAEPEVLPVQPVQGPKPADQALIDHPQLQFGLDREQQAQQEATDRARRQADLDEEQAARQPFQVADRRPVQPTEDWMRRAGLLEEPEVTPPARFVSPEGGRQLDRSQLPNDVRITPGEPPVEMPKRRPLLLPSGTEAAAPAGTRMPGQVEQQKGTLVAGPGSPSDEAFMRELARAEEPQVEQVHEEGPQGMTPAGSGTSVKSNEERQRQARGERYYTITKGGEITNGMSSPDQPTPKGGSKVRVEGGKVQHLEGDEAVTRKYLPKIDQAERQIRAQRNEAERQQRESARNRATEPQDESGVYPVAAPGERPTAATAAAGHPAKSGDAISEPEVASPEVARRLSDPSTSQYSPEARAYIEEKMPPGMPNAEVQELARQLGTPQKFIKGDSAALRRLVASRLNDVFELRKEGNVEGEPKVESASKPVEKQEVDPLDRVRDRIRELGDTDEADQLRGKLGDLEDLRVKIGELENKRRTKGLKPSEQKQLEYSKAAERQGVETLRKMAGESSPPAESAKTEAEPAVVDEGKPGAEKLVQGNEPEVVAPGTEKPAQLEEWKAQLAAIEARNPGGSKFGVWKDPGDKAMWFRLRGQIGEAEHAAKLASGERVGPPAGTELPDPNKNPHGYQKQYFIKALEPVRDAWKRKLGTAYANWVKKAEDPTEYTGKDSTEEMTVRPKEFSDDYIKIDVPGDGKFAVRNTPYAIEKLLKSAPSAFAKPSRPTEGRSIEKIAASTPTESQKLATLKRWNDEAWEERHQAGDEFHSVLERIANIQGFEPWAQEKKPAGIVVEYNGKRYITNGGRDGYIAGVPVDSKEGKATLDWIRGEKGPKLTDYGVGPDDVKESMVDIPEYNAKPVGIVEGKHAPKDVTFPKGYERTWTMPEADEARPKGKGTKMYSGAAILDPEAWRELFPGVDQILGKVRDRISGAVEGKLTSADLMKGVLRQKRGVLDQRKEQMYEDLQDHSDRWAKKSVDESLDFIRNIEQGTIDKIADPQERSLAKFLRTLLDEARERVQRIKPSALQDYIENYFPHIWENPSKARKVFQQILGARRPLEGPASFLKRRTIDTTDAGIEAGLKPVTYNPVDLALLKLHEMNRYTMAQEVLDLSKRTAADPDRQDDPAALKLATFAEAGTKREKFLQRLGWKQYEDRYGTVYGSPNYSIPEYVDRRLQRVLKQVGANLGIEAKRGLEYPREKRTALGVSYSAPGRTGWIETKANTPLSVWSHELMHQLDSKFDIVAQTVKNKEINKELRKLSDLTYEGSDPDMVPDSFKKYVRSAPEKVAHILEMYASDRGRLAEEFPKTNAWLKDFLAKHDELAPLRDLKGGIAYAENVHGGRVRGKVILGHYWGPPDAVDVFNRNLSPGLAGRSTLYDIYRGSSNVLNQAQLGLSAFHLGFTSLDASISDVALGIEQLSRGNVSGLGAIARGATFVSPFENAFRGNQVMKEYLEPGSAKDYAQTARAVAVAGGRIGMDPFYKNEAIRGFKTAIKDGRYARAAARAIPAFLEATSKPIMEWVVPRQKLGVFHKMVGDILDRARTEEWDDNRIRSEVQKAWDSVDNRMGQIVYDNLFWNRVAKDLGMASVRSLGWNLGTVREIAGGGKDALTQVGRLATGKKAEITHRMAYVIALPMVVGMYGALYHYLSTGQAPQNERDLFFPKGPDGNRVSLPSYMKDVYAWRHHPGETLTHKVHPALQELAELYKNRDFYGNEIRNEDDPIVQQALQVAKYGLKGAIPLGVRNVMQSRKQGGTPAEAAQSFVGITPAPSYINKSEAYNLAQEYSSKSRGEGTRTTAQAEIHDRRADIERQIRQGKLNHDSLIQKIRSGEIPAADAKEAYQASKVDPLVKLFRSLPIEEALNVWDKATPDEQKMLRVPLAHKAGQLRSRTGETREALKSRWLEALGRKPQTTKDGEPLVEPPNQL